MKLCIMSQKEDYIFYIHFLYLSLYIYKIHKIIDCYPSLCSQAESKINPPLTFCSIQDLCELDVAHPFGEDYLLHSTQFTNSKANFFGNTLTDTPHIVRAFCGQSN